jgi:hypothetical protein
MKITTLRSSEKGQSFVEMGVSFTVILILMAGLVDAGTLFFSYMTLRDAAEEGVNYGMYNPRDLSGIEARVRNASSRPLDLTDTNLVNVTILEDPNPCLGKSIAVTVTYHYEIASPFLGAMIGSQNIPITAAANGPIISETC